VLLMLRRMLITHMANHDSHDAHDANIDTELKNQFEPLEKTI